ncbi:SpoIIE family protein phosphatase [Thalassobaculum sp.]|uniref:SpoIIE family protein phosphatase n=1 Tax=Thalassobaculum sp. TaxID=2022740 RepID=UPI0032EDCC4F
MLTVLDQANDPGKGRDSEDRVGHRMDEGIAWVLDGATDVCATRLFPNAPSDAFWFADAADELLRGLPKGAATDVVGALIDGLRERVERRTGRAIVDIPPGDMPSAALTWICLNPQSEQFTLASYPDCTTIVLPPTGAGFAVEREAPLLDEQAQARALIGAGADIPAMLRAQRALMNRPDGYPVLSVHRQAVPRLDIRQVTAPPGTRVLLCTDGFFRLTDMYALYTADALIRAALDGGLSRLIERLRSFEADAGENVRFGRFKTSDDAAALLLQVT